MPLEQDQARSAGPAIDQRKLTLLQFLDLALELIRAGGDLRRHLPVEQPFGQSLVAFRPCTKNSDVIDNWDLGRHARPHSLNRLRHVPTRDNTLTLKLDSLPSASSLRRADIAWKMERFCGVGCDQFRTKK